MIERIEDMPSGTVGLRASGRLSKEEYAWMTPGEVKIYEPSELEEAKRWVAG